jgi:hypothetical protein
VITARDAVPPESVAHVGGGVTIGASVGFADGVGLGTSVGDGVGARLGDADAAVGVGDAVALGPVEPPQAARTTRAARAAIRIAIDDDRLPGRKTEPKVGRFW